jgi:hypothetical protein
MVQKIDGYDESFMHGLAYEDVDFFFRLFKSGADFLFHDSISGTHIDHERDILESPAGAELVEVNKQRMIEKYETEVPWYGLRAKIGQDVDRTIWMLA